jgi:hypothetical protein
MKAATKTKSGDKSQNGQLITVTLNKALSAEAEWDDKVSYTVLLPLALSGLRHLIDYSATLGVRM